MKASNGTDVDVIAVVTNGQSFAQVAEQYTIGGAAYGPAVANFNNMGEQDITGKRFRIEIPLSWVKVQAYGGLTTGGTVVMPGAGATAKDIIPGVPNWLLGVAVLATVLVLK